MPNAKIVYVNIDTNKHNEEQTQLRIGFDVGDEVVYMRYIIAGGSSGQQKFASMQLSKLLKLGGGVPVTVEENDRGYKDVYADDGFRKASRGGEDDGGF